MKAIMVMFDSLNRHMLPPYGNDWVKAPNFERLAQHTVTFENCYAGSLPCMPARRELHTGRYNFLHRSWGPIEPFDDSLPELLKTKGIYTHLVTDHFHYWEDGGSTYHGRYNSYELVRGQQSDAWKGHVKSPDCPDTLNEYANRFRMNDLVNRQYLNSEEEFPQAKTFTLGMDFIKHNKEEDGWFLQLETFDPHEPFVAPQKYKDLYPDAYEGPLFDYPPYRQVKETPEQVNHCRNNYAALVSMCDEYLGKVLDIMDELGLWEDTMLIVNTDHGFFLGEHQWWGKTVQPYYNEVAKIPLFIWDPRNGQKNKIVRSLVQTIDIAPTLLEFFEVDIPKDMQGIALKDTIISDKAIRDYALFGSHGGYINCTDGRYVYMRAPVTSENKPLYNYTMMPAHMRGFFRSEELVNSELTDPFEFTKKFKLLKCTADPFGQSSAHGFGTMFFDTLNDPHELNPLEDEDAERIMIMGMIKKMKENDSPPEQYKRLGLEKFI